MKYKEKRKRRLFFENLNYAKFEEKILDLVQVTEDNLEIIFYKKEYYDAMKKLSRTRKEYSLL